MLAIVKTTNASSFSFAHISRSTAWRNSWEESERGRPGLVGNVSSHSIRVEARGNYLPAPYDSIRTKIDTSSQNNFVRSGSGLTENSDSCGSVRYRVAILLRVPGRISNLCSDYYGWETKAKCRFRKKELELPTQSWWNLTSNGSIADWSLPRRTNNYNSSCSHCDGNESSYQPMELQIHNLNRSRPLVSGQLVLSEAIVFT